MNERRLQVAVGLACVLLVVAPALLHPTGDALGLRYVDGYGTYWWFWYLGEVLAGRQDLVHTDLLFHPWGKEVFAHTGGNLLDFLRRSVPLAEPAHLPWRPLMARRSSSS